MPCQYTTGSGIVDMGWFDSSNLVDCLIYATTLVKYLPHNACDPFHTLILCHRARHFCLVALTY